MRVLVAGLGNMGRSHALAWAGQPGAELVGLVNRSPALLPPELADVPQYRDFHQRILVADGAAVSFYAALGFSRAGRTESMWIYAGGEH